MNTFDDEIDLKDIILAIWNKRFFITSITTIFAIFSVFYALSLPNIYQSNTLLAPTNNQDSLSGKFGGYSSLAGMAGISLPSESSNKTIEAIERIKSYDFFVNNFIPNIQFKNLVAAERWNKVDNSIEYNNKIFIKANNEWLTNPRNKASLKPSYQEAFTIYSKIMKISQDKKTSFVSISIEHPSPLIAQQWLKLIIKNINNQMKEIEKSVAENSIIYLKAAASQTNISEIKTAISELIQSQLQTLMLVEANDDYTFTSIASPIAPEKKSKPSRSTICIVITFLGFIVSLIFSIAQHLFNKKR